MNLEIEELEPIVAPDAWDNAEHFVLGVIAGISLAAIIT